MSRDEDRAAFLRAEGNRLRAFMDQHASEDFQLRPGDVSYSRSYRCECGFSCATPEAIWNHVAIGCRPTQMALAFTRSSLVEG